MIVALQLPRRASGLCTVRSLQAPNAIINNPNRSGHLWWKIKEYISRQGDGMWGVPLVDVKQQYVRLFGSPRPGAKLTSGNPQAHPRCLLNFSKVTCQQAKLHSALSLCFPLSLSFFCTPRVPGPQTNGPNKSDRLDMSCHCTLIPRSRGGDENHGMRC